MRAPLVARNYTVVVVVVVVFFNSPPRPSKSNARVVGNMQLEREYKKAILVF